MDKRQLSIQGAWEFSPTIHRDLRGHFVEVMNNSALSDAVGYVFPTTQMNTSVSTRAVLRGVHYALTPPGQAKYVTVSSGSILDFVIDLRLGSPTFGQWEAVELTAERHNSVFISEGLGHAFIALSQQATVCYLVSAQHDPAREFAINPLDPQLGLAFPVDHDELIMSERDKNAPSLADQQSRELLPLWQHTGVVGRPSSTRQASFG